MAAKRKPDPVENVRPIIVKKIIEEGHGGHHGGAWKVAYADFVTAMMAFFLLMWLLGATEEKDRKAIADYFAPTMVQLKNGSAGTNGLFGGESIVDRDSYAKRASQTGTRAITIPQDATGTNDDKGKAARSAQQAQFEQLKKEIEQRLEARKDLQKLMKNVRFTDTREGLRIDLVDEADFSMFALSTDALVPKAAELLREVAQVINGMPNPVIIRGHTDALPYASGKTMNNWMLSTARAEATRKALVVGGINPGQVARIEGVADKEPFNPQDRNDPANRRMSITLAFTGSAAGAAGASGAPLPGSSGGSTAPALPSRPVPAPVPKK
ncbi:MAG: flagellar motor protein MotB [Blastomonas fulva]|jgi:chemotaxis protein MotB|uniref:Flagellar motor protein MotB n=1 Tax=Blastomonas fulva TaxID=1550728 RepID=A0ABN5B1K5_9SPHN|nr:MULTISPECIES: flagellar motor protein MotB [Blastomonas]AOG00406.1 membrane MotB of proton-channel complex MotA/MotB family protein [Blastomonas sp. RAC04]ASR50742.1 flagellar motor protein MotB [Blastomonas fulva]MCO5791815.1 OmpA family protein [Blastomonas sp.]MDK2757593.1 OmpA family protein [Blastomonas fulva]MDM7927779.1 flagellar motor protein MotB [Blastomonas fulva]